MEMVPVFCGRDCGGDACPLLAVVEDGSVTRIQHNPEGRTIKACPKGFLLPHQHYSPERLLEPLVRTGNRGSGQFRRVSWKEALSLIKEKLETAIERYGPQSILSLASAGSTGALHNTETLTKRFLNCLGGHTSLSGNYSSNAANHTLRKLFGSSYGYSGFPPESLLAAEAIILLGANILEARLGAGYPEYLEKAAREGKTIIAIDPRKTKTASLAGVSWIPLLPGTDSALLYAILQSLEAESLIDHAWLAERAEGAEQIFSYIDGKTDGIIKDAGWAERQTGIPAATIRKIAQIYILNHPVLLFPGYSIQRTQFGEEAMRLAVLLQLATQNFGVFGGSTGSLNNKLPGLAVGKLDELERRSNPKIPILRWPDAVLEGQPRYPDIHVLYSAGGNFLNQGADIRKNIRAFMKADFVVSHEMFMTPTARYSDVILPVKGPLQKEDIGIPWAGNFLLYKPQILKARGDEKSDYEIFNMLASMMHVEAEFSKGRSEHEWIAQFLQSSEVSDAESFMKKGIWFGDKYDISYMEKFLLDPQDNPLGTRSGKLEFSGARARFDAQKLNEFFLVTPKRHNFVHSQGGDFAEVLKNNPLQINSNDARRLGIQDGDCVKVSSETGWLIAPVRISDDIRESVVSLHEGSWFVNNADTADSSGSGCASPNLVTATDGTAESCSCIMHGIPVSVSRVH